MYIHQKNEQGSPDPLPSQMVPPSPPVAWGVPNNNNNPT